MKKNKIFSIMTLALTLAIGVNTLVPSITASAQELTNKCEVSNVQKNTTFTIEQFENASEIEFLDDDIILIDGQEYDFEVVADTLCKKVNTIKPKTRNAATATIKKAAKWLVKNWNKVYNKLPNWAKQYFKLDGFISVMDQFIGISDSIEDFFHDCFRAMGMPESANWAITNVIMLLLPI